MAWWNIFRRDKSQTLDDLYAPRQSIRAVSAEVRARETLPSDRFFLRNTGINFLPRRSLHTIDIDKFDMNKYNAQQILDILSDVSGEVSLAVWNVLRLGAVNWKFEVRSANGARILTRATTRLQEWVDNKVNSRYGGFPSILRQMFYTTYLQGAHCVELEVDETLMDVVDIHPVQPWTIFFERNDQDLGYDMFQKTPAMTDAKQINQELVWYVPLDPAVDDPYGRSPAAAVIWPLTFDLQFIRDLKQAVHIAGWGRLDVSVVQEVAIANAPPDVKADSKKLKAYLDGVMSDIKQVFESLRSDDTFIHTDAIKIETKDPSGRMTTLSPLARLLEIRLTRGLKQLPVLMGGVSEGTETQGTTQYEIYSNGLQAMRDIVGFTLSKMFEQVLRVWGIQGQVVWEWDSIRTKDRLREAQAQQAEIINTVWQRDQGWIDNDEAAEKITGKPQAVADPLVFSTPGPVDNMPNSISADQAKSQPSPTDGEPGRPIEGTEEPVEVSATIGDNGYKGTR